jgi:hypothetical protein
MESVFFYSLIILVIIGFVMHNKFLNRLKEKYPFVWESLGRPTLFTSIYNSIGVQKYIFKKNIKL